MAGYALRRLASRRRMPSVSDRFEAAFMPGYAAVPSPEFPASGRWTQPVYAYARDGTLASGPNERWGAPFVILVDPGVEPPWVGMFSAGGLGGIRSAFATPRQSDLCVVVDGLAYVVDVHSPGSAASVIADQVRQVETCRMPPRLFLATWTGITALGPAGLAWREPRLGLDGLRIHATSPYLKCEVEDLGGSVHQVELDPESGRML